MTAFYNEIDPFAAQWLRNLIEAGHIAPGIVDERSIEDIRPEELASYVQCHFFAGIGGWSYALRLAGWPDDRPVWTGSCPCQPFSIANVAHGGAKGKQDDRHLLPKFCSLIGQCVPPVVFGEQVANAIKKGWLDEAFGNLENVGYACAAAVLPAIAFGARHERKRLYWVSHACGEGWKGHKSIECIPVSKEAPFSEYGNSLARARQALDGDISDILPGNGVSVAVERRKVKGYGNAIVPQVAAKFIQAYLECQP